MLRITCWLASLLLLGALSGCGSPDRGITVHEPWVRAASAGAPVPIASVPSAPSMTTPLADTNMPANAMLSGATSAAYMTLVNVGSTADRLLGASSDAAQDVQLHTSEMENNVMRMREVPAIDVPANGEAVLKPGGYHVMLLDLTRDLTPNETITLTLTFERAGEIQVQVPVRAP